MPLHPGQVMPIESIQTSNIGNLFITAKLLLFFSFEVTFKPELKAIMEVDQSAG